MNDDQIVALYYARDERAITKSSEKYGVYCTNIAQNILQNLQDSEECDHPLLRPSQGDDLVRCLFEKPSGSQSLCAPPSSRYATQRGAPSLMGTALLRASVSLTFPLWDTF